MRVASLAYTLKYYQEWGGGLSNDLKKKPTNIMNVKFAMLTENDMF